MQMTSEQRASLGISEFSHSYAFRQRDVQKKPVCRLTKAGLMLDSGHSVPHSNEQAMFDHLNLPPELLPMIPREKIKTKKVVIRGKNESRGSSAAAKWQ